jgi:polysaccharide pyruvyl transferase WcaK-like protein
MLKRANYEDSVFERFDQVMEEFIASAKDSFDIFLIQHAGEDGKLMRTLAKKHNATFVPYKSISDAPVTYSLIQSLDLMIGVRLHSIALGIMAGVPTIAIGSVGAKQKRLIDYALPSMKDQFYGFTDVEKLDTTLKEIISSGKIHQNVLSDKDLKNVKSLNLKNRMLLEKMINAQPM